MKKLTPVLAVEEIEPCLPFWVDRLGFAKVVEVAEGEALGFVMLQKGAVEVMLQSRASIRKDVPALAEGSFRPSGVMLYIEVDDLAPVLRAVAGCEVVVPERTTFYGMREIAVRAPGGFVVAFAARAG
jgi:uncharacterized glyoxalase superfamily protein PhnB